MDREDAIERLETVVKGAGEVDLLLRESDPVAMLFGTRRDDTKLAIRCEACVESLTLPGSAYRESIAIGRRSKSPSERLDVAVSCAEALLQDVEDGYLTGFRDEVRVAVEADYLAMAGAFLREGGDARATAAAVLIGCTLEQRLRDLSGSHGLSTVRGDGRPLPASTLNVQLCKAGVYNDVERETVESHLALRNHAAHGRGGYSVAQVASMRDGVLRLLRDYPA